MLAGVLVWTAVVASGAGVTWVVVDAAGRSVLADRPAPPLPTPQPGPGTTGPSVPPAPGSSPAPPVVSAAWRGDAGTVVTRCRTATASLGSASPSDGWRVVVQRGSGRRVAVRFERGSRSVTVEAGCVAGAPVFSSSVSQGPDEE